MLTPVELLRSLWILLQALSLLCLVVLGVVSANLIWHGDLQYGGVVGVVALSMVCRYFVPFVDELIKIVSESK